MSATPKHDDLEIGAMLDAAVAPLKDNWRQVLLRAGLPLLLLYILVLGPMLVWLLPLIFSAIPRDYSTYSWSWAKTAPLLLSFGAYMTASLLIVAILNAALFRFYNGEGLKGQFLAFRFGKEEVRQFFIILLVFMSILVLPSLPLATVIAAMVWASSAHLASLVKMLVPLVVILTLLWPVLYVFIGFRLILAPALTFMQKRLRLIASWRLTRGHFWTLFITFMVIFVGFGMVSLVLQGPANILLYMPPSLASLTTAGANQSNIDPAELSALIHQVLFARKNLVAFLWMLGIGSILYIFQAAFMAGASLYASRRLGAMQGKET